MRDGERRRERERVKEKGREKEKGVGSIIYFCCKYYGILCFPFYHVAVNCFRINPKWYVCSLFNPRSPGGHFDPLGFFRQKKRLVVAKIRLA